MIYVNETVCDGCGLCVEACPTGALVLLNHRAYILQNLCEECQTCVYTCPRGAILTTEAQEVSHDVIRVQTPSADHLSPQTEQSEQAPHRDVILPALGSILLWTGRELLPRLADLALAYIDQKIQYSTSLKTRNVNMRQVNQNLISSRPSQRGYRRQRRRNNSQTHNKRIHKRSVNHARW